MKVIGSVVVPADLVGSRVALVRGIQRGNCEKGCRFAGDCTLLGAVLAASQVNHNIRNTGKPSGASGDAGAGW